ncbi:flagellar export chaperone FlgN [Aminipila sp.]|uniref:flagellar export chaperone FlgN n=1 Tax=Aminipila sp. TaxID=2060095 RepID=UPI0028A0F0DC|nr:flagellar export chaperone FlgN [Aminipila sp.]
MMNNYAEIKDVIEEYIKLMDLLIDFEQKKLNAVKEKDIQKLDNFLKEEQVYLLKLKGLDQKREGIQKKLGVEGLTYRQIIEKTEGTLRSELENSYEILAVKTKQFNETLNTLKSYIDIRLHTIEEFMKQLGAEPVKNVQTGIYDKISNNSGKAPEHYLKSTKA